MTDTADHAALFHHADPNARDEALKNKAKAAFDALGLNTEQLDAANHTGTPVAVLAGPGTGKTRVITARILRLIAAGTDPRSIVALTFTNKATREMHDRLAAALDDDAASRIRVGNFHRLGTDILARFGSRLGLPTETSIADSATQLRRTRDAIADNRLFPHRAAEGIDAIAHEVREFIAACQNAAKSPADALAYADACAERLSNAQDTETTAAERAHLADFTESAKAYAAVLERTIQTGALTFDDLITLPIRLLTTNDAVAAMVRQEITHVVVDEFQDLNPAQIEMLRAIVPPSASRPPDLCVVGDDDQSIYGFRGAAPDAFRRFADVWGNVATKKLTINYRSAPSVIELSNRVVTNIEDRFAPDKLGTPNPDPIRTTEPGSLELIELDSDHDHGAAIAAAIHAARDKHLDHPPAWSTFAVITRNNTFADTIAAELRLQGIPVDRREKRRPAEDPAVQDALAWARLATDPGDTASAQRLLVRPPIGLSPDRAAFLIGTFRKRRSAAIATNDPADDAPASLITHLRAHADDDPNLATFLDVFDEIAHETATQPADAAIEFIIRRAGLIHADAPRPERHADRVRDLVRVIQSVRERMPAIDQPRSLHEFLIHYDDLEGDERNFVPRDDARTDDADANDTDTTDAVTVTSAHQSKGLEFDTVFIARVRPGNGFPWKNSTPDDPLVPHAFTGITPQAHAAEERRLFFVACTRAERRLILLAKTKKKRGKTIDYTEQLTLDETDLPINTTHASTLIEHAQLLTPGELDAAIDAAADHNKATLERQIDATRRDIAALLHRAERPDRTVAELEHIRDELGDHAATLAALAHLRHAGTLPNDYPPLPGRTDPSPPAIDTDRLRSIAAGTAKANPLIRPLTGPLNLSFTFIDDYLRCPACFYARHVLKHTETPDASLSVGGVVHRVLQSFFERLREAEAEGQPLPSTDDLREIARNEYRRELLRPGTAEAPKGALEQITALAQAALHTHQHDDPNILFIEQLVRFPFTIDSTTHTMTAKIDRIDQLADGTVRIIDYKTGHPAKKFTEPKKDDLQLGIYAVALPHVFQDDTATTGRAEYWLLKTSERGSIDLDDLNREKIHATIADAVRGMAAGEFEKLPKHEHDCRGLCWILD